MTYKRAASMARVLHLHPEVYPSLHSLLTAVYLKLCTKKDLIEMAKDSKIEHRGYCKYDLAAMVASFDIK